MTEWQSVALGATVGLSVGWLLGAVFGWDIVDWIPECVAGVCSWVSGDGDSDGDGST